jgi:hypothetical protein
MLVKASCIPGCCGFMTVKAAEFGWTFIVYPVIAEKTGLAKGEIQLHVFQCNRGINFVLNGKHLHLMPHPWKKRKTYS